MTLNWLEPEPLDVSPGLVEAAGGSVLAAQVLARRGITDPAKALAFLDPRSYTPCPPEELPDLERACQRIERAIQTRERLWVWGDFDVDGQTSTALLVSTLRLLGAQPGFHIPVRANESHGVNIANLDILLASGADLMLTCDTGITAHEALAYAQSKGLEVIVTDHHALGASLPPALACVTPRRLPPGHAFEGLPGVGVAYKLAEALLTRAGRASEATQLLDLAALGIVADVASQTGDTRYLLQRGLDVLRRSERAGLRAMFEAAEVNPAFLNEEHIGFNLAPRLNALGRLSDANSAVELFTTSDPERARVLANELEALNARRQLLTRQVLEGALSQIKRDPALVDPPILILAHPEWPAGVIGIVASQLAERYNRPVILLAAPPNQPIRGSARSIEGIDITACIAEQAEHLLGFGGHPMAAGLSLPAEKLPALRRGLARSVAKAIEQGGGLPVQSLKIDTWLALSEANLDLVAALEPLSPFGMGNPALVFAAQNLSLIHSSPIGRSGDHLQLIVEDPQGERRKLLWWGGAGWPLPTGRFDLAYNLRASNYRGQREVQIQWLDFRPVSGDAAELQSAKPELVDYRNEAHQKPLLERLRAQPDTQIWAEAEARELAGGLLRDQLSPAHTMVLWTCPPGRAELQSALEQVQPKTVVVFGLEPQTASLDAFLQRLAGLVKFSLNKQPDGTEVSLARLAGACAQREASVRKGLAWLEARGMVQVLPQEGDLLRLSPGTGQARPESAALQEQIRTLLDETSAYRRYFRTAPLETLL
jgi:single-stranded-DNA-specific exonuclease